MLRLQQAPNIAIAAFWVDVLRESGIQASVQGYYLGAAAGELPPDQCLPQIWVMHEEQAERAREVLRALARTPQHRWTCTCGEQVEGGFEQCWRCGAWMPA